MSRLTILTSAYETDDQVQLKIIILFEFEKKMNCFIKALINLLESSLAARAPNRQPKIRRPNIYESNYININKHVTN
jgi:hypothetical protein